MNSLKGNTWKTLTFSDVSRRALQEGFRREGLDHQYALHITATASLAKAMRKQEWPAISVKELMDAVVWSGMPGDLRLSKTLPSLKLNLSLFEEARGSWRGELRSKTTKLGADTNDVLRAFLDQHPDRDSAVVLRRSVADLSLSIKSLASAGISPDQLDLDRAAALICVAAEAWTNLEVRLPHVFKARDDFWIPRSLLAAGAASHVQDLWQRIDTVMSCVSSSAAMPPLVYHGFYFFTPPQWAWFTTLKELPGAHQYFVVHDDGTSRVFEVWRRFFGGLWGMPESRAVGQQSTIGQLGDRLREALEGRRVDTGPLAGPGPQIRLTEFRDAAEFAAEARTQQAQAVEADRSFELFAADAENIERLARRFGLGSVESADLADTPLGQFLLALHKCVRVDASGILKTELTGERLLDMAASGFLDTEDRSTRPSQHVAAIRLAIPFFSGLLRVNEWKDRSRALESMVASAISAYGLRSELTDDASRLRDATRNPLRLAPWCDLSEDAATAVRLAIERVEVLLSKVLAEAAITPNRYLRMMQRELSSALRLLPESVRRSIRGGMRQEQLTGNSTLSVEGIIEQVAGHLRRGVDAEEREDSIVAELRNLDALGFESSDGDVHLANLADTVFPARTSTIGWPFNRPLLDASAMIRPESREISRAREDASGLADIYLFWLALNGTRSGGLLYLSSIATLASERRNPSPLLMLIAEVEAGRDGSEIAEMTGGFRLERDLASALHPAQAAETAPTLSSAQGPQIQAAIDAIEPIAMASAEACPRRFALQWALGDSHSFPAEFQQRMLFGNVAGALANNPEFGLTIREAYALARNVWRHLTPGERLSSLRKRRVLPVKKLTATRDGKAKYSSDWQWIFTLGGDKNGDDPTSNAYKAARGQRRPAADQVAPPIEADLVLPLGTPSAALCRMCPARPRCSAATFFWDEEEEGD